MLSFFQNIDTGASYFWLKPGFIKNYSDSRILVQNQSLRETIIPEGTVIGHIYLTESVTAVSFQKTATQDFD